MVAAVGPVHARVSARRVGQPVPVGHTQDQIRGVRCGYRGCGDEQQAYRGFPLDCHRVGSCAEPGLGHPGCSPGPAGVHIVRMPEPRASIETVSGPLPAGSQQTAQEITERNSPR